nr:MAG TPA: trigger factor [Caudoviricetes sp.]
MITTLGDNVKNEYEEYKEEDQSFENYLYKEYSYKSIDEFDKWSEDYAQNYLKQMMIVYIIAYENNITVSSEDIINKGNEQAELYDYNGYEDIVTQYGNEMNTELGYAVLYTKVMDFLVSISISE